VQQRVCGIVGWPGHENITTGGSDGVFLPDDYSWQLPRPCPPTLLFIDGRGALTARMIAVALRRGVGRIVFSEGGGWRGRPLLLLAFGKLSSKVSPRA